MSGDEDKKPEESPTCYQVHDDGADSWNYEGDIDLSLLTYSYNG